MLRENPKIFISYSWADHDMVWPLAETLAVKGLEVWIDKREVRPGDRITEQVQKALVECGALLLMWSQASSLSDYVRDEWNAALAYKKRIIPCLLDGTNRPSQLSDVLYVDFRDGDKGVEELLRELSLPVQRGLEHDDMRRRDDGFLIENIPYRENPNFTGRQADLAELRKTLLAGKTAAITQPVSISGLGGVGKTQLAIQYVYLHRDDYKVIWWLRAEGSLTLAADYAALAERLDLPERHEREQEVIVAAVRKWLETNRDWLLILDNAQEQKDIQKYFPQGGTGHTIVTSRNPNWRGIAVALTLEVLSRSESVAFLLRRTGLEDEFYARALANTLGDLPLALEQAAAYIEATGITFADYLELFHKRRKDLLTRGKLLADYPESVVTTWEISFRKVKAESAAAIEFLQLCAFLAPDEIPIAVLRTEKDSLPKILKRALAGPIVFNDVLAALRRYSLVVYRNDTVSLHRLVQAVTRDRMPKNKHKEWSEAAVNIINNAFPFVGSGVESWPQCAKLLPHAQVVCDRIKQYEYISKSISELLNKMGKYLNGIAGYSDATPLLRRALENREAQLGPEHPDVATSLDNLAVLLKTQGKYAEVEPLSRRALKIREKQLGPKHLDVAMSLSNLAELFRAQGKYADAESFHRRALEIRQKQLGLEHSNVAASLNNLAVLLAAQGKYLDAEPLYRCALDIYEKQLGSEHPDVVTCSNNLAELFRAQGKYLDAEPLFHRAVKIREKSLGPEHPSLATSLNNLAELFRAQGKYVDAESFHRRALKIWEKQLGPEHPNVATSLNNLALLFDAQGKYADAEPLFRRALEIREKQLGLEHPETKTVRKSLESLQKQLR